MNAQVNLQNGRISIDVVGDRTYFGWVRCESAGDRARISFEIGDRRIRVRGDGMIESNFRGGAILRMRQDNGANFRGFR